MAVQEYRFMIKCEGETSIPLRTLCSILDSFNDLSDIAVDDGPKCEYKISAFQPGSFETEILGQVATTAGLFLVQNANYISSILQLIKEALQLKIHLKGRKAKKEEPKGDHMEVTNQDGQVIQTNVDCIRLLENANNVTINLGTALQKGNIEGLSFIGGNGENLFRLPKETFPYLARGTDITPEDDYQVNIGRCVVAVRKWISVGREKWSLNYLGHTISAKMQNEEWLKRFQSGKIDVNSKDRLDIDLRSETPILSDGRPDHGNARFYILKVHGVKHVEEENENLMFGDFL